MSHEIDELLAAISARLDQDAPPITLDEITGDHSVSVSTPTVIQLRTLSPASPSARHFAVRRLLVAAAAVLLVAVAGVALATRSDTPSTPGANVGSSVAAASTVVASTTTVAPTTTVQKTSLAETIGKGVISDDVKAVQQRLTELGFVPGPVDGVFGSTTQQAVWAYEKLVLKTPRADATGRVTDEMWQGMQEPVTIAPRRPTGSGTTHMEIYVPEQVAIVFIDDVAKLIAHISTGEQNPDGTPKNWCETLNYDTGPNGEALAEPVLKQECADAKTPGGIFKFTHRYEGKRVGPLGGMMNPVYFNYGIAVHGADNVPLAPASHGCVRLNQTIAKIFPSLVKTGDAVYVWAQDGKEPEDYTKRESLPSFNYADPNATTTTSTTTTSVPPTTVPATTTPTPTTAVVTVAPPAATSTTPVTTIPETTTSTG
jgi:peptidoglycan hydrolase-like protein with peptidoglycan-binding domain